MTGIIKYLKGDLTLWIIVIILSVLSIPTIYSAAGSLAFSYRDGNTLYYLIKQIAFIAVGLFIIYAIHKAPFKLFYGLAKVAVPVSVVLLILTLIIGQSTNDAVRWLPLFGGFHLQTSDVAKISLIMYVSLELSVSIHNKEMFEKSIKKIMWTTLVVIGLIVLFNLSTAVLIFFTVSILMLVGGVEWKHVLRMTAIAGSALIIYMLLSQVIDLPGRADTWISRIVSFFSGSGDDAYQATMSKIAIADGSFLGNGPGKGTLKYIFPQAHSDFIFAFIIEEYGVVTGIFILLMYSIFFYRGIEIAKRSKRSFRMLLALGLTLIIVFQAFANMAVAVGVLPVTGQTLPLLSLGGTSVFITSAAIGLILNISRNIEESEAIKK